MIFIEPSGAIRTVEGVTTVTERWKSPMNRRMKVGVGILAGVLVLDGAGAGVAEANGADDDPVTGSWADQERAAATRAVPAGTTAERDGEAGEGALGYDAAVTKPEGSPVELHLHTGFHVLDTRACRV